MSTAFSKQGDYFATGGQDQIVDILNKYTSKQFFFEYFFAGTSLEK